MNDTSRRCLGYVAEAARLYSSVWRRYDEFRARRDELGDWPQWCFAPLSFAYSIVEEMNPTMLAAQAADIGRLGALSAWRPTQGVYRFDPTLIEALIETSVEGDLPASVLKRLPEWCVYVEYASGNEQFPAVGFFAHLEWDVNTQIEELRLLVDMGGFESLIPFTIYLGGTLAEGLKAASNEATAQSKMLGLPAAPEDIAERVRTLLEPMVSLVIYQGFQITVAAKNSILTYYWLV